MNNVIFKLSIVAVMLGLTATANAEVTTVGSGGTINFEGSLVQTACTVDNSSKTQTVDLKSVDTAAMVDLGAKSPAIPFTLKLTGCDITVQQTATFGFTGDAALNSTTALKNLDIGGTAATNVGVQIENSAGGIVPIDGSYDAGSELSLTSGDNNTANFTAYMISTAPVATAGSLHSTVNFLVQYN